MIMNNREVIGRVGAGDGQLIYAGQHAEYRQCTDPFCTSVPEGVEHGHTVIVDDEEGPQ